MSNQELYCGKTISEFGLDYYMNIYVNITIPICLVGMILNLLNVLVFTRKTMNSPANLILAHLAFVDFLVLLTKIADFWIVLIRRKRGSEFQESYVLVILYWYIDISVATAQFISAFLTVHLTAWRYIAVVHPLKERHWCSKKITRNVVVTGYIVCCVLYAIPYHFSFDIETYNVEGNTSIYYYITFERHPIMHSIRFIIYGLIIKLLPPVVSVGLTSRIVVTLFARKTRREQLTSSASIRSNMKIAEMRQKTNTSTAILLAVVALFFIAEFPRGILWLLRTINEEEWHLCYDSLLWVFATITSINVSITFMVYYSLSQQFRTTFKSLFSRNPRRRTRISHQTHAPTASRDTKETFSGWETSEV